MRVLCDRKINTNKLIKKIHGNNFEGTIGLKNNHKQQNCDIQQKAIQQNLNLQNQALSRLIYKNSINQEQQQKNRNSDKSKYHFKIINFNGSIKKLIHDFIPTIKELNKIKQRINRVIQFFKTKNLQDSPSTFMGNNETKQTNTFKDWQKVDTDNGIQIYRNTKTNELAQKRIITLGTEIDIKNQVKVYKMRQNNNDALVRAFGSEDLSKKADSFVSCAGQNKIFVMTQKMPHRLSQLPQLTFPQSLLFLRQSLRAYQKLFKEYGPVEVTKQLIGLNYLGEVKSWLNSNWALNHRGHQYTNLRSKKLSQLTREQYMTYREQYLDQPQMIKDIISVIQKKCQDGRFPQAFKEEVISQSGSFKKLLLYLKDFVEYNQIYVPERINYEELVNIKYHIRLQQQLNFNAQRAESQLAGNGNRQGQTNIQSQVGQQGQNGFLNMILAGQQLASNQATSTNQQIQLNRPLGYQSNVQQEQGFFQKPLIPEPLKESPVSSDMGQVTFSQSTRNYSQKPLSSNQAVTNYQWSAGNENLYTPSFQKVQQSPQISSYSSNQVANYNFGGNSSTQEDILKPKYTGQAPGLETSYQGINYSSSLGGLGTGGQPSSKNINNGDYSYNKYTSSTYGNTGTTGTPLEQEKSNIGNYGLSNNTYNFSNNYSSISPAKNLEIGGIDSGKGYQNISALGYGNLENKTNLPVNNNVSTSKWSLSGPATTPSYVTEAYTYGGSKPAQNSYNNAEKVTNYSFGGKDDFAAKFGSGYNGTGYSNTLTKYESQISTNPSTNFNVQGNYSEAFNSLLNPSLRGQTFEQITSGQSQVQNGQNTHTSTITETVVTTTQQKRQSSNISGSNVSGKNVVSEQQSLTPRNTNPLEAFTNMIQRASNDVSESVLKME